MTSNTHHTTSELKKNNKKQLDNVKYYPQYNGFINDFYFINMLTINTLWNVYTYSAIEIFGFSYLNYTSKYKNIHK